MSVGTFKALYDYIDIAYDSIYNIFNSLSIISVNIGYIDKHKQRVYTHSFDYDLLNDKNLMAALGKGAINTAHGFCFETYKGNILKLYSKLLS